MYIAVCVVAAIRNLAGLIEGVVVPADNIAIRACRRRQLVGRQELLQGVVRIAEIPVQVAVFVSAHKGIIPKRLMGKPCAAYIFS